MFKRLFCKHEYIINGYTYVKCRLCGKVKEDRELAGKLINDHCNMMIDRGLWDKDDVGVALARRLANLR